MWLKYFDSMWPHELLVHENFVFYKIPNKQMQLKAKEDKSTDLKGEGGETAGTFKQIRVSG